MKVAPVGLGLAKHWFQVHGVDERGHTVVRRKLRRSKVGPCRRLRATRRADLGVLAWLCSAG